jgi:hypothetical protein
VVALSKAAAVLAYSAASSSKPLSSTGTRASDTRRHRHDDEEEEEEEEASGSEDTSERDADDVDREMGAENGAPKTKSAAAGQGGVQTPLKNQAASRPSRGRKEEVGGDILRAPKVLEKLWQHTKEREDQYSRISQLMVRRGAGNALAAVLCAQQGGSEPSADVVNDRRKQLHDAVSRWTKEEWEQCVPAALRGNPRSASPQDYTKAFLSSPTQYLDISIFYIWRAVDASLPRIYVWIVSRSADTGQDTVDLRIIGSETLPETHCIVLLSTTEEDRPVYDVVTFQQHHRQSHQTVLSHDHRYIRALHAWPAKATNKRRSEGSREKTPKTKRRLEDDSP